MEAQISTFSEVTPNRGRKGHWKFQHRVGTLPLGVASWGGSGGGEGNIRPFRSFSLEFRARPGRVETRGERAAIHSVASRQMLNLRWADVSLITFRRVPFSVK